jgi:hypothetical protein
MGSIILILNLLENDVLQIKEVLPVTRLEEELLRLL